MPKKGRKQNKEVQKNTPKPKYTNSANLFYTETVVPLERAHRKAMKAENFGEAGLIYAQMTNAMKEHQLLLQRREWIRIK